MSVSRLTLFISGLAAVSLMFVCACASTTETRSDGDDDGEAHVFVYDPEDGDDSEDGDSSLDGDIEGKPDGDEPQPDGDDPQVDGDETQPDGDDPQVDGDKTQPDGDAEAEIDAGDLPLFSFFVTSLVALQELSGNQNGFGGDLRYGETGDGAGLRGADKICAAIAERSMPGSSVKQWRAFLSATDDGEGNQVDAIDRIGEGPWYDRMGRMLAPNRQSLLYDRPQGGNSTIKDDFPNEDGVLNHQPDPTQPKVDNHDMLTGTGEDGRLYSSSATCKDWTTSNGSSSNGKPRVGHSWPRSGGGPGGKPGGENMDNWMSALTEAGCAAGVNLAETGGPLPGTDTVGSGGGYGGFYCFALIP